MRHELMMPAGAQPSGGPPSQNAPLDSEHRRLQNLVGELLQSNRELRFKVEHLQKQAETAERGLKSACAPAALLLP